ncbi:hypothetical protein C5167_014067 [Papaver somniferum]|uniref:TFIIS N-terminal domain-containing protein n=1 Tax=Papaver somniferum TaxID=3469 RepID=A0A4Y7J6E1_PAPSO|nr:uncharacterized protein LOC113357174 [Papaver somniferum]XP_026456261.1 uncharacterized protein LOC113357174 [Papaver somniferum]XP_026456262.1 uncharacterized protein LOC113357174 [Papaver somniferum]XP_026456263.1 uncharacterized protein LOC113357174 [Papaver somniferum]RZC55215.1 hypothetical protein C5167_014067 [Papaver somniferum]
MTLVAFFTLTDMKDGLLTPAKIEEWIAILKNENLYAPKNMSEAARQWCTAASTLASTENKDSLDQFVRLDGLFLLNKWLRQTSNSNEISDGSVEESIRLILGALMKLPVGRETCDTSGIRTTVNNLLGHKCAKVQEIAKSLFDSWNGGGNDSEAYQQNVVNENQICTEVKAIPADSGSVGHGPLRENADEKSHLAAKPVGGVLQHTGSSGSFQSGSLKDVQVSASSEIPTTMTLKNEDLNEGDAQSRSILPSPPPATKSPVKESSLDQEAAVPVSSSHSQDPIENNFEEESKEAPAHETKTITCGLEKTGEEKLHFASSTTVPEPRIFSSDPPSKALQSSGPSVLCHVDAKDKDPLPKKTTTTAAENGPSALAFNPKSEVLTSGILKQLSSKMEIKSTSQMDGYSNALANSPIDRSNLRKQENQETTNSRKQCANAVNHGKELTGKLVLKEQGGKTRSSTACNVSSTIGSSKLSNIADKNKLDMELDFMIDDALEVATQVAKEVRRQVVDYREPVCGSSSDNNSDAGGVFEPKSPDSINGELHSVTGRSSEMSTGENLSAGSNQEDDHSTNSENMGEPRDSAAGQDLPQVTADAHVPEGKTEKSMCDFDLNDEVSSEEVNHQRISNSPPAKFASPSKLVKSDFTAEPPLCFVEEQGSKRSAAASEKTVSAEECSPSFKQRQDFRGIDLNLMEGDKSEAVGLVVEKQIPVSSGLPSGESCVDVNSRKVDRLELDLNLDGDNENMPSSDWRTEGRFAGSHLDSRQTLFTSASSSLKQASLKNIDLNEVDFGTSSFQRKNSHGGFQVEKGPIISIMGTRVEVRRNEFPPQTLSFLPNGQATGSSMMDVSLRGLSGPAVGAQPAIAFAPSPSLMFDYGGLTMGHTVPPSFSMYGAAASAPYAVDYRGAPVAPELMGFMEAGPSSYSRPYLMSMGNQSSPLDGVGPSTRPVLDLNFGLTLAAPVADGEFRESGGGLRQLLSTPGNGSLVEQQQQMRLSLQPLSSGLGLKRSEPDSGWDGHPVNFKHQSQWR